MRWRQPVLAAVLATALFGCTGTDPVSDTASTQTTAPPATTTPTFDLANFSVDQITNTPPSEWTLAIAEEALQPVGAVSLAGKAFVFGADGFRRNLRGWSTSDGVDWEDLGPILPVEQQVAVIGATDTSVVIVTEGRAGRPPEVWTSADGLSWTTEEIPVEPDNDLTAFSPHSLAASDDLMVVTGQNGIDAAEAVGSLIRDRFWPGYDADRFQLEWTATDETADFRVLAPGGMTVLTTTPEELGLEDDTLRALLEEPAPEAVAWVRYEGGGWERTTVTGATSVDSMSMTDNGSFVAVGHTELDLVALWVSFDGFLWEQLPFSVRPEEVAAWNGDLVGPAGGTFDLITSADGIEWSSSGLGNHFPSSQQWFPEAMGASPERLAVAVARFDSSLRRSRGIDIPYLEKGDAALTLDPFFGELMVFEDEESRTWGRSDRVPDGLTFDPTTETIRLERPDGTVWAEVTLSELETLARQYGVALSPSELYDRTLATSEDGSSWVIEDLATLGGNTQITDIAITETSFVLATTDHSTGSGLAVYIAPIP